MLKYGASFSNRSIEPSMCMAFTAPKPPPILEESEVNHPNIKYEYNDKHFECINAVPSIEMLVASSRFAQLFRNLNEIEYSANVRFESVTFERNCFGISERDRYYINDIIPLHYSLDETTGNGRVSTLYFPNSEQIGGTICTRFDYETDESHRLREITAKLKVVKTKFNYCGVTYSLTGSVELPFDEMAFVAFEPPTRYSKRRYFIYWNVYLTVDGRRYEFRIAFRRIKNETYDCNIECEDAISGSTFILCFDLLAKYYKRQYIAQNRVIQPLSTLNPMSMKLTAKQRQILQTMYLVIPKHDTLDTSKAQLLDKSVENFVKFISVEALKRQMQLNISNYSYANVEMDGSNEMLQDDCDEMSNDEMFD